jgi:hypothetical protein
MRHRREAVLGERDFLQPPVGRVLLDPLPLFAVRGPVMQLGRIAIRGRCEPVELVARKRAEAIECGAAWRRMNPRSGTGE